MFHENVSIAAIVLANFQNTFEPNRSNTKSDEAQITSFFKRFDAHFCL